MKKSFSFLMVLVLLFAMSMPASAEQPTYTHTTYWKIPDVFQPFAYFTADTDKYTKYAPTEAAVKEALLNPGKILTPVVQAKADMNNDGKEDIVAIGIIQNPKNLNEARGLFSVALQGGNVTEMFEKTYMRSSQKFIELTGNATTDNNAKTAWKSPYDFFRPDGTCRYDFGYAQLGVPLEQYIKIYDFNGDGKRDIFYYYGHSAINKDPQSPIKVTKDTPPNYFWEVYINTTPNGDNTFQFKSAGHFMSLYGNFGFKKDGAFHEITSTSKGEIIGYRVFRVVNDKVKEVYRWLDKTKPNAY